MMSLEWAHIQDGRVLVRRVNLDPDRESLVETGRNPSGGPTRPGVPEAATRSRERGTDAPSGLQKDQPHDTLTVGPTAEPGEQLLCVSPPACRSCFVATLRD